MGLLYATDALRLLNNAAAAGSNLSHGLPHPMSDGAHGRWTAPAPPLTSPVPAQRLDLPGDVGDIRSGQMALPQQARLLARLGIEVSVVQVAHG